MDGSPRSIRYPWDKPPALGTAIEVAEGVLWFRLPLPMALDHVNVFALRETDGWTVVDTGVDTPECRAGWEAILSGPMAGAPVRRVLLTHHHPDHVGLAGWFQTAHDAELWTTRTAWLYARMLSLDVQETPHPRNLAFLRQAGMPREALERRRDERPFNFCDIVAPLPPGFRRIVEGEVISLGGRDWDVRMGHGHAPEHATLWCRDAPLVLGGDQLLPSISPIVGVHATEPDADPLAEWLDSCRSLAPFATEAQLVLPGHKLPYVGLPSRIAQLIENHTSALERLLDFLAEPRRAPECFTLLFRREVTDALLPMALSETIAHLNHLQRAGRITRETAPDGVWQWRRS